ncbi:MAG: hypothetical protein R3261_13170 [Alphaproteobacteria bacterium]|nr:hypothetical protein [Alphaproteobacteria bacterium]
MELESKVLIRSFPGMPRGGDTGLILEKPDGYLGALIDASGHGLEAYNVAKQARRVIINSKMTFLDELLLELDFALKNSIGAAISLVKISEDSLQFAGIGNVQAYFDEAPLKVRTGVVGVRMRTPHIISVPFESNKWFLMHTDGISRPKSTPNGNAETVANKIMESYGTRTDDAGILLFRRKTESQ